MVFIAGNQRKLGNWRPDRIALKRIDRQKFQRVFRFPAGTHLEYKFTLGSWDTEALDERERPFANFILDPQKDTTVVFHCSRWHRSRRVSSTENVVGRLCFHRQIEGVALKSRDVVVWLPPGYDEAPERRYPVLYMHDGQNLFDPGLAGFGVEWRMDEVADSLIRGHLIEPLIIVGIYNTADRSLEYGLTRQGKAYRQFVVETVKPLIDLNYRTLTDRKYTATGGSSMGGLVSFILAWENPHIFSKALCLSPAFRYDRFDYARSIQKSEPRSPDLQFYIDNGGLDLEAQLQPGIDAMLDLLRERGWRDGQNLFWLKDPLAPHHESAWAQRLPQALQFLFPLK